VEKIIKDSCSEIIQLLRSCVSEKTLRAFQRLLHGLPLKSEQEFIDAGLYELVKAGTTYSKKNTDAQTIKPLLQQAQIEGKAKIGLLNINVPEKKQKKSQKRPAETTNDDIVTKKRKTNENSKGKKNKSLILFDFDLVVLVLA
jgi:hypothetical protein